MRKKFLIKPAFQLRHLGWTLGVVFICFGSCYMLFEGLISTVVSQGSLDPIQWDALKGPLRLGFGVALIILMGAIGLENYLFFHSIAGPLFVLERGLRRITNGDFQDDIQIRDTDQLRDVILAFQEMRQKLAERFDTHERGARALTAEIDRALAGGADTATLLKKLKEIREQSEKLAS